MKIIGENRPGEHPVVDLESKKKENTMNELIVNVFGDWESFRRIVKESWEYSKKQGEEPWKNKEDKSKMYPFTRKVIGNSAAKTMNSQNFYSINSLIKKEIEKLENPKPKKKKETKTKSKKEKYIQGDISFG